MAFISIIVRLIDMNDSKEYKISLLNEHVL